jgi:hypothetical protein
VLVCLILAMPMCCPTLHIYCHAACAHATNTIILSSIQASSSCEDPSPPMQPWFVAESIGLDDREVVPRFAATRAAVLRGKLGRLRETLHGARREKNCAVERTMLRMFVCRCQRDDPNATTIRRVAKSTVFIYKTLKILNRMLQCQNLTTQQTRFVR